MQQQQQQDIYNNHSFTTTDIQLFMTTFGFLIPTITFLPFAINQILNIQNCVLLISIVGPLSLCIFRTLEGTCTPVGYVQCHSHVCVARRLLVALPCLSIYSNPNLTPSLSLSQTGSHMLRPYILYF